MQDLAATYQRRRALTRLLQESQARESRTLKQIGQHATDCKRDILLLLSRWLQALRSEADCPPEQFREMDGLTGGSLKRWLELQSAVVPLEERLAAARGQTDAAMERLSRAAPAGLVSKWLAGPEARGEIQKLQVEAGIARKAREAAQAELDMNTRERKRLGEQLLRDWIERCDPLSETAAVGRAVTERLGRMTQAINAAWEEHRKQEVRVLDEIARTTEELRAVYAAPGGALSAASETGKGEPR